MGVVDLLGIISFFLLSLVVRKLVVGYLKDTNAGECFVLCDRAPLPSVVHDGAARDTSEHEIDIPREERCPSNPHIE